MTIENLKAGRIELRRADRMQVVDLGEDIAGCTGVLYDRTANQEFESAPGFEIVDETRNGNHTYLLLLASAPANCNVQGECGAGPIDSTLIWLKLSDPLSLSGKQAVAVVECRAGTSVSVSRNGDDMGLQAKDLPWIGDTLTIDLEQEAGEAVRGVIYNRRHPDSGLELVR